ncbi:hypothetical protein HJD18_14115 [Thermoleophilia bacterium SCSIO 60948]|nr:hypothetical protein HJD18_14115 [Thermoleophilia bacterium SCSIO 60948]
MTTPVETSAERPGHPRVALVLVWIASLTLLLSTFGIWADRQLFETSSWTETTNELLAEPEVTDALADYLVAQLYEAVDVEELLAARLPDEADALAAPAGAALRRGALEIAGTALASGEVQALWTEANESAHGLLIDVLEGGGEGVSTEEGVVTLDLGALLARLSSELGLPGELSSRIPPGTAELEVLRSDELATAQSAVTTFKRLAWALVIATLLLYAVAIAIAGARRRETVRAIGLGAIAACGLALLLRQWAGTAVVDELAQTTARPAAETTWEVGTSMLAEIAQAGVAYGIAIVFGAWLAGPTALATSARRTAAPYLAEPRFAFGGAAVLLALLFWWAPTPAFERIGPSLLAIVVVLAATEALRRRTTSEFPSATTERPPSAGLEGPGPDDPGPSGPAAGPDAEARTVAR